MILGRHGPSWPWVDLYGECTLSSCPSRANCAPNNLMLHGFKNPVSAGHTSQAFGPCSCVGVTSLEYWQWFRPSMNKGCIWAPAGILEVCPPLPQFLRASLVSFPLLEPRCLYPSITPVTCACLKTSFIKFIASFPLGAEDCLTLWQAQPMSLGFASRLWAALVHCHPRSPCIR